MSCTKLILLLVIFICILPMVTSFCPRKCSIYDILECPPLPKYEECFPTRPYCSCCRKCSGQLGSICNNKRPKCRPDMLCKHKNGITSKFIYRLVPWFNGTCQLLMD